ncbi:alpha/beta hydrolase family protein [Tessaracoccus sp. G1721]
MQTPKGQARAHLACPDGPDRGLLVLGHGAGGGVDTADLRAARSAGLGAGYVVALVEQPYRVAGRKAPPPIAAADAAWVAAVGELRALHPAGPLVVGGRSFGGRVACRTSMEVGADAVLCLAFPLVAPSGSDRSGELESVEVPVLIVQGRSDPFGMPGRAPGREVVEVEGNHSLRKDGAVIEGAIAAWLRGLGGAR